jgi:hypothetical protein
VWLNGVIVCFSRCTDRYLWSPVGACAYLWYIFFALKQDKNAAPGQLVCVLTLCLFTPGMAHKHDSGLQPAFELLPVSYLVMTLFEMLQDFTSLSELPHDMDRMSSLAYLGIERSRSLRMLPESLAFSQFLANVEVPSTVVVPEAVRIRCEENVGSVSCTL